MTLLKDNNYKEINVALLSLEADIKNKITNFDTSEIDKQLAEINSRIDKINTSGGNNSSDEIEDINSKLNSNSNKIRNLEQNIGDIDTKISGIEQKLSDIFSAENKVTDFNTTTASGVYYWVDDAANRPTDYGVLLVNKYDGGDSATNLWINQIAYGTNSKIYFRQNINSAGWTEWKAVAFDGELNADTVDNYHASDLWRSDGATWNPNANVTMTPSGNGDEWSFDFRNKNGATGTYWHVWDENKKTLLKVNADDGKVSAPYGFVGNLSGKADTAGKASFLDEYVGAGGTRPTSGNLVPKDSSEYGGMRKDVITSSMTDSGHPGQDGHLLTMFWDNSGRYDSQLFVSNEKQPTTVKVRVKANEADYGPWVDLITSQNIGSQTVAKAGNADAIIDYVKGTPIKVRWGGPGIDSAEWYPAFSADGSAIEPINRTNIHAGTADRSRNMYYQNLDLSALDRTKFYPLVCYSGTDFAEVAICSESGMASMEYNQNRIHFDISTMGWSDTPPTLNIREYGCYDNSEITIGCIGRGIHSGAWAIWLRGGLHYTCFSRNSDLSLHTSDYTYGDEVYTVGTNYYGGSNSNVEVVFTPQSTITGGAYSSRPITAPSIKANNKMRIPIGAPSSLEDGCIWIER